MWGRVSASFAAAALVLTGAALLAAAQGKATPRPAAGQGAPKKVSARPEEQGRAGEGSSSKTTANAAATKEDPSAAHYVYEFEQPDFFVYFVHIEHDDRGHGSIRFERRSDTEQLTDPLEISPAVLERIRARFAALKFLDSTENYQGQRTYPSQGKTKLTLRQGGRERTAEFNYSQNTDAQGLAEEYRRISEQALFVFDIGVALESQPLETPKLIDRLDTLINSNFISDRQQLVPLLRQLAEDERVPLVGRNQAARILKKLEKQGP
ncbi:MAG TPA: hypothetical protein VHU19_04355 [Pyrinomonadaceae bacterium]|jgi:hypothetical protein|nr:hypothetical protein [Pyrinomonadaceae bacterium]